MSKTIGRGRPQLADLGADRPSASVLIDGRLLRSVEVSERLVFTRHGQDICGSILVPVSGRSSRTQLRNVAARTRQIDCRTNPYRLPCAPITPRALPASWRRDLSPPKRRRYCAGEIITLRRNSRLKKLASR